MKRKRKRQKNKSFVQIQVEQMIKEKERLIEKNIEHHINIFCLEYEISNNKKKIDAINRRLDWIANYPKKTLIL